MIDLIKVSDREEGQQKAHTLLKKIVDKDTLLALSGGTTPNYQKMIVESADILPGAICVVDERFGKPFHKDSNELLLKNQGIKEFADKECIESHKILKGKGFLETAKVYEKEIEDLFKRFKKKVGVMGVGDDLHTAGIFPHSSAAHSPDYVVAEVVEDKQSFSANKQSFSANKPSFSANKNLSFAQNLDSRSARIKQSLRSFPAERGAGLKFPKRISLTMKALGEFTNFAILMFGQNKKEALRILLDGGVNDMQKYPAIFYRKAPVKSYLITDITL